MKNTDKLSPKGVKIVAALAEFRDTLKAGRRVDDCFTVRTVELDLKPRALTSDDVKRVREMLSLSQPLFALFVPEGFKSRLDLARRVYLRQIVSNKFFDQLTLAAQLDFGT